MVRPFADKLYTSTYIRTYRYTYLLTPYSRVLLVNLTGSQLVKKFPAFYGTRRFITAFTNARHLSLSWASSIQSMPSHPTYLANSLATTVSGPDLYRLLTFHVPNLMSHFHSLGRTKVSVRVRGKCSCFVTKPVFLLWGVVSTSDNPQAGGLPLVGCSQLHIQCIRSYSPYWRPFLHPQPEDAPCRGDRDPFIMGSSNVRGGKIWKLGQNFVLKKKRFTSLFAIGR